MNTYWFEVVGEDSILCGEQFFVEADNYDEAHAIVNEYFPNEEITCYGKVSEYEAEMMGFDTY